MLLLNKKGTAMELLRTFAKDVAEGLSKRPKANAIIIHNNGVPSFYEVARVKLEMYFRRKLGRRVAILVEKPTDIYPQGSIEIREMAVPVSTISEDLYL